MEESFPYRSRRIVNNYRNHVIAAGATGRKIMPDSFITK